MNNFCIDVALDIDPLTKEIESYGNNSHTTVSLRDINPKLNSYLKEINLTIIYAELFYTPPHITGEAHTDGLGGDYIKINFVYYGKNSTMNWYAPKSNIQKTLLPTNVNASSNYLFYKLNEVDKLHEQSVKFPSIVQVGIPHSITTTDEHRYCLSLVPVRYGRRITMQKAKNIWSR